jgi:Kef-type K+ transport system membrane component KefB
VHGTDLLSDIGMAIVAATALAVVARAAKQPLILAYLLAGVVVGPEMGFGLVRDHASIELISEIGLILLLFIIGLEMDLQKLLAAGRPLIIAGLLQFPACVALGMWFAVGLGLPHQTGRFDAMYVGVAMALSSTMIVVKLLYDKYELMTVPGRITLGILVFQDIWAILVLAIQPSLLQPSVATLAGSLVKGVLLVFASLGIARYFLPRLFAFVAKVPELLLVTALAWCFLVAGTASWMGLSREMGALVAGVGMSTFPYNLDVIAKVINIRDFFVTLFFVALGMQIPMPTAEVLGIAVVASLFLVATRFLTVFPVLYATRSGLRTSLLGSINLSQMSEFSLVIVSLGAALGHIGAPTVAILTFVFVITSVSSTYMITFNHALQRAMGAVLRRLGFKDTEDAHVAGEDGPADGQVVMLGFFRDASSILHQLEMEGDGAEPHPVMKRLLVIDFNPTVLAELKKRGVRCLYGDLGSMDMLHHAPMHGTRLVVSTITDTVLKGTSNLRLLKQTKKLIPEAEVLVASDTIEGALALYDEGADFVFVPRLHSASHMAQVLGTAIEDGLHVLRAEELAALRNRNEVLA